MADNTQQAPLEDLMVAMDVVDTLRHQQGVAERELDNDARRERLLERLKSMYQAQGIDVPEHVLVEGIDALEQERFSYEPIKPSWRTKLAHVWVSRARWGKPIGFLAATAVLFFGIYFFTSVLPEQRLRANLPNDVGRVMSSVINQAKNPAIVTQAQQLADAANAALDNGEFDEAKSSLANLKDLSQRLTLDYRIRVISRPDKNSGVWRIPPNNNSGRNYYLIVEAVDRNNRVIELTIVNEENNKAKKLKTWGLRVSEDTFYKIASDKRDDGIIQNNQVGTKRSGYLQPDFSVPTTGSTITEW